MVCRSHPGSNIEPAGPGRAGPGRTGQTSGRVSTTWSSRTWREPLDGVSLAPRVEDRTGRPGRAGPGRAGQTSGRVSITQSHWTRREQLADVSTVRTAPGVGDRNEPVGPGPARPGHPVAGRRMVLLTRQRLIVSLGATAYFTNRATRPDLAPGRYGNGLVLDSSHSPGFGPGTGTLNKLEDLEFRQQR
jgi:hypothetical protein